MLTASVSASVGLDDDSVTGPSVVTAFSSRFTPGAPVTLFDALTIGTPSMLKTALPARVTTSAPPLSVSKSTFSRSSPGTALPLAGVALGAGLAVASVAPLAKRNLARAPLHLWGMVIAHLGIAVSLAGMAISTAYTQETLLAVGVGDPARIAGYTVRLEGVRPLVSDNWSALEGRLALTDESGARFVLRPQVRYFTTPVTTTNESAIATMWNGQLYTVLGALGDDGRWQLRLWWKPFVTLIWLGGALIAIGGALSLVGHQYRLWRTKQRAEAFA